MRRVRTSCRQLLLARSPRLTGAQRLATLLIVAALLLSAASSAGAQGPSAVVDENAAAPKVVEPPTGPSLPPDPTNVAEDVVSAEALSDAYGGSWIGDDGRLVVNVLPGTSDRVRAALAGVESGAYVLRTVPRTWQGLVRLRDDITEDAESLSSEGIDLGFWGPDARTNTVEIGLRNYSAEIAEALKKSYGPEAVTVVPDDGPLPERAANRYYDNPPFWNGDRLFFNGNENGTKCTSGFSFRGNASGNVFNLTAGHCTFSSDTGVWTNFSARYKISNVSTRYYTNYGWDLASYRCDCGAYVWYEGPSIGTAPGSTHRVTGTCRCGPGTQIAADGATTGQVAGANVLEEDRCYQFGGSGPLVTCHLNLALRDGVACQPGDSGGPMYQRQGDGTVLAAGYIVGNDISYRYCYYHPVRLVMPMVNGTMRTN